MWRRTIKYSSLKFKLLKCKDGTIKIKQMKE